MKTCLRIHPLLQIEHLIYSRQFQKNRIVNPDETPDLVSSPGYNSDGTPGGGINLGGSPDLIYHDGAIGGVRRSVPESDQSRRESRLTSTRRWR